MSRRAWWAVAFAALLPFPAGQQTSQASVEPRVSVWYRGTPAGVPKQDELAAIRAHGFTTVTWPDRMVEGLSDAQQLGGRLGLTVLVRGRLPALDTRGASEAPVEVTVEVDDADAPRILALCWRAIAHGTRVISFDARQREGAGLTGASRRTRPWVGPAVRVARYLSANAEFIGRLRPGPPVTAMRPLPAGVDAVLLDGGRAWVLVATNLSSNPASAIVRLPRGVPYGLWMNLLDGTEMSMLSTSDGPRWSVALPASGVFVYGIDKEQRLSRPAAFAERFGGPPEPWRRREWSVRGPRE